MNLYTQVLDWIFPPKCVLCGRILAEKQEKETGLCGLCRWQDYRNPEPLGEWGRCSLLYEDELQQAIQSMKYKGKSHYAAYFARWMMEEGGEWALSQQFDRVSAVPLSRERMKSRGYNQAELIAREVGRLCRVPYETLLARKRDTQPQSKLGEEQRRQNLEGAFAATSESLSGRLRHICLVDDIYTTGSTVLACREALQRQWPEAKITYWVLAGRISSKFC